MNFELTVGDGLAVQGAFLRGNLSVGGTREDNH